MIVSMETAGPPSHYLIFTKQLNGDSAFAFDSDVESVIYVVSNPTWVGVPGFNATTISPPVRGNNDVAGQAGGGLPTTTWASLN